MLKKSSFDVKSFSVGLGFHWGGDVVYFWKYEINQIYDFRKTRRMWLKTIGDISTRATFVFPLRSF